MNIHVKNKKTLVSIISVTTVAILILTGTFAWSNFQKASTGGRAENFDYVVMLLDKNNESIYQYDNWKITQVLDKAVYATSKYEDESLVKTEYDKIAGEYQNKGLDAPVFSDTWVRIKIEEYFSHNGPEEIRTAKEVVNGKLVSSFGGSNGYFELVNGNINIKIITLTDWSNKVATDPTYNPHGRFWILDESSGWMYWAQPVLAPTVGSATNDQETDHIIDKVKLTKQPSGSWEYKIKATLEAMDVELNGYENEGVWSDITPSHKIHQLFGRTDESGTTIYINMTNFPDANFRTYLYTGVETAVINVENYLSSYALDKKLTITEISKITWMALADKQISTFKGIEHFTLLTRLNVGYNNNLSSIDLSKNKLLAYLYINNTNLSSLDVNNNRALIRLDAYNIPLLTSLDVSNNPAITKLRVYNCPSFTSLVIGTKEYLATLHVQNNRLSSLDISGIPDALKTSEEFTYNPQVGGKTVTEAVTADTVRLEWQ